MKKLFFYAMLFTALLSCSKNEDVIIKITLSADKTTLLADGKEAVTFTVKDQDGTDVTSSSVIKINGKEISGGKYTTTDEGNFVAIATYKNAQSNELTIQANKPQAIVLKADKVTILANGLDKVTFTVFKPDGTTEITATSKIKVNGIEISGNTYVATKEGEYKAVAVNNGLQSNEITVQANKPEAIVLSADKVEILNTGEDKVTFTVKKPDGTDITKEAKIMVNDKEITGNIFTSKQVGSFMAIATWNGNKSNYLTINVKEPTKYGLVIKADKSVFVCDNIDMSTFTCINTLDSDNDLTNKVTFYVDGKAIEGNAFKTTTPGQFTVTAKYETHEAPAVKITAQKELVITPKILLEDYTGTWCPNCPRCIKLVNDAVKTGKVVGLAIHQGDIMEVSDGKKLIGIYNKEGLYPTIIVDRKMDTKAHGGTLNDILKHLKTDPKIGATIDFKISGNEFIADVKIVSKETRSDIKCVAYLAENGIKAAQAGDESIDTHHHALRAAYNGEVLGQDISVTAGTPLSKTFKFPLSAKYKDENNCEVIILITNKSDNTVINVQRVQVGRKIGY